MTAKSLGSGYRVNDKQDAASAMPIMIQCDQFCESGFPLYVIQVNIEKKQLCRIL